MSQRNKEGGSGMNRAGAFADLLAAVAVLACAGNARAQAVGADEPQGGQMQGDAQGADMQSTGLQGQSLAGADGGFAPGEVPVPKLPYEQAATQPEVKSSGAGASFDPYAMWLEWKSELEKKTGTSFELYINPSDQAVVDGPNSGTNRAVVWYNFHVGQQLWTGAQVLMNARGDVGDGVGRYGDSLFNVNQHAGETSRLYISHLFFQQKLLEDKVTLSIGKLDLDDFFDENEVASWNLIPYSLARNPSIPAPYHAIGAVARWDVTPAFYVQAGAADAGGNPHQTGFNTVFKSHEPYFGIAEAGVKTNFFDRPGTYRAIFWHQFGSTPRFDGTGELNDSGFGFSGDQQITDKLSLFARYGYSEPSVRRMEHYIGVGANLREPIPGRTKDVLGAEVAEVILSNQYRAVSGVQPTATQVDMYYTIHIAPWLSLTPDIQMILNSDNGNGHATEIVTGLYSEWRF